ncbi:MAG: hypothetical protein LBD18_03275 [Treponema sp.]|jgi:hypothetical protein|nr:hypothetical protein [Treponema sp.]
MQKLLYIVNLLILATGMLILGGCPEPEQEAKIDSRLVGDWSNQASGDDEKKFSIADNGSFTAELSPAGADGRGRVQGKLTADGAEYIMNGMHETTGKSWGNAVNLYNGTHIQIELSSNKQMFELKCRDNTAVVTFFGGQYHKQ